MEQRYNLRETAEILGVKVRTLREWIKTKYLTANKYEGRRQWYVSQSEIERIQGEK